LGTCFRELDGRLADAEGPEILALEGEEEYNETFHGQKECSTGKEVGEEIPYEGEGQGGQGFSGTGSPAEGCLPPLWE